MLVYNSDAELLRQVTLDSRLYFQDAIHLNDECYIFGSNQGLILYDFINGNMERIYKRHYYTPTTPATLLRESDSTFLYGSVAGIRRVRHNKMRDNAIDFEFSDTSYYSTCAIKSMCRDASGRIYLGLVSNGVHYIDKLGDKMTPVVTRKRISTLLLLSDIELWVGTFDDGAMLYDCGQSKFKSFDTSSFEHSVFRTTQICPYGEQSVLCRHNFYNLSLFDIKSGKLTPMPFKLSGEEYNNLRYIHTRANGDLCFLIQNTTRSWWCIIKSGQNKVERIEAPLLSEYRLNNIVGITEDQQGFMWIASEDLFLRIQMDDNYTSQRVENLVEHPIFSSRKNDFPRFRALYIDPLHPERLYAASSTYGLYVIDTSLPQAPASELPIEHYYKNGEEGSPSSNFIAAVIRTPDNTLWVGTERGGVCRVDESAERLKFQAYSTTQGLANNSVKGLLYDKEGRLWVATNHGLSRYDLKSDRFESFRKEQGVPFNIFEYSAFSLGDQLFFAGGSNSCYFDPSELPVDKETPLIIFDKLKLYDQTITPMVEYNGRVILQSALKAGDLITLKHDERHFTISIDVMSSHSIHNHTIQYRMLPISEQWSTLSQMSEDLSFRGLQPDLYELQVRYANALGELSDTEQLYIRVKRPLLLTGWALSTYVIFIILAVVLITKALMKMQKMRYQLHIEAISKHNLEQLNSEKMRYFSNISHEIKTPITLITAPLSQLSSRFSFDTEMKQKLLLIKRQAEKISELVELMHGVHLNDSNLLQRSDSEFVLEDMLRNICADFKNVTDPDQKALKIECSQPRFMVCADCSMIEKIVDNLLSNAIKHTRVADSITMRCSTNQNIVRIEVEDTGYGISQADLPHLFERFFRASNSANVGGTGIGLYFTKTLVEMHRGNIEVRSQEGIGSTFTVELPIKIDAEVPAIEQQDLEMWDNNQAAEAKPDNELIIGSLDSISFSENGDNHTPIERIIYVVEDNSEMRRFVVDLLSNFYSVKGFENGEEVLQALELEWPDIIISDVMMPQIDGYELCERIKSNIKTSHIPVILLTASSTVEDRIKGLSSGADSYIPKPFHPQHLFTRIETLLDNRQRLRERFEIGIPLNYGKNSNTSAKDNEFMMQLYDLFNKYIADENISLNDIALEMGQNRSMFFQKVKVITNTSPFELLKEYRLKRAAEMLSEGNLNVNEVCMQTGFKDRSHFSRLFKDRYGASPSKWKVDISEETE